MPGEAPGRAPKGNINGLKLVLSPKATRRGESLSKGPAATPTAASRALIVVGACPELVEGPRAVAVFEALRHG